jgi:hypothetical protein
MNRDLQGGCGSGYSLFNFLRWASRRAAAAGQLRHHGIKLLPHDGLHSTMPLHVTYQSAQNRAAVTPLQALTCEQHRLL